MAGLLFIPPVILSICRIRSVNSLSHHRCSVATAVMRPFAQKTSRLEGEKELERENSDNNLATRMWQMLHWADRALVQPRQLSGKRTARLLHITISSVGLYTIICILFWTVH